MTEQATNSQKGKSGILASVRASVGVLSLAGEPGQQKRHGSCGRIASSEPLDGWQSQTTTCSTYCC